MSQTKNEALSPQDSDNEIIKKMWMVSQYETEIDPDNEVYLITWCPDPKEMSDADFEFQHLSNVDFLAAYLQTCKVGLFCVEATQAGNPHYHGWYQVNTQSELQRITCIKTMERFGLVKITKCLHLRLDKWFQKANGLYYYKKDLLDSMLQIEHNPICAQTQTNLDVDKLSLIGFIGTRDKKSLCTLQDTLSAKQYYLSFYKDSRKHCGY